MKDDRARVSNFPAWVIVILPVLSALLQSQLHYTNGAESEVFIVVSIIVSFIDIDLIRRSGKDISFTEMWTIVVPPIYLWVRSRLTNQGRTLFWFWWLSVLCGGIVQFVGTHHA